MVISQEMSLSRLRSLRALHSFIHSLATTGMIDWARKIINSTCRSCCTRNTHLSTLPSHPLQRFAWKENFNAFSGSLRGNNCNYAQASIVDCARVKWLCTACACHSLPVMKLFWCHTRQLLPEYRVYESSYRDLKFGFCLLPVRSTAVVSVIDCNSLHSVNSGYFSFARLSLFP